MNQIKNVAIIGAGTMGSGIAFSAVSHGFAVMLIDPHQEVLDAVTIRLKEFLDKQVNKQRISRQEADCSLSKFVTDPKLESAANADLVIEAVYEDLQIKRDVFETLEKVVAPDTVLATNTSALKVSDIGKNLVDPGRLCGTHYFSPAAVNPVVEVIKSNNTSSGVIESVLRFLHTCQKTAIECRDSSGFALNRFFCPYTNEAARCLDDELGTPNQIDDIAKSTFGVAIGPFRVMNIVKPAINLAAIRSLEHLGSFYGAASSMISVGDAGADWDLAPSTQPIGDQQQIAVSNRLRGAVFLAVLEVLHERVAEPNAVDTGAMSAFTFAVGPVEMMRRLGREEVARLIGLVSPDPDRLVASLFQDAHSNIR